MIQMEIVSTLRKTCPSATVRAAKSHEDSAGTEPRRPERPTTAWAMVPPKVV
jgi:hypothetical protein